MDIRIGKAAHVCAATGRPFEDGEEVVSLVRTEDRELVREDYARSDWDAARAEGALAVWSHHYHDPKKDTGPSEEQTSPLRQAFYELEDQDDRESLATAYMAAQLLRRQKVFRLVKESEEDEDGVRAVLFADRLNGRLIEVRDPGLTYAEMEQGSRTLMQRLSELENPEPAETGDAAEPAHSGAPGATEQG